MPWRCAAASGARPTRVYPAWLDIACSCACGCRTNTTPHAYGVCPILWQSVATEPARWMPVVRAASPAGVDATELGAHHRGHRPLERGGEGGGQHPAVVVGGHPHHVAAAHA